MDNPGLGETLPVYWILPFAGLLLSIALLPLFAPKFWERNRNKAIVAAIFGLPIAILIGVRDPNEIAQVIVDYFSFITLLTALFIISGGIHLKGDLEAKPTTNASFLLVGTLLANLIGTTGASMLLIRAVLRTNQERKYTRHIPIFFIFLVSNIGGALLPLGDPPLFLGYLRGVPFFWTLKMFPIWAFTVAVLLALFLIIDSLAYSREEPSALLQDRTQIEPLRIEGGINFLWLLGVLLSAVLLQTPNRELVMWLMALVGRSDLARLRADGARAERRVYRRGLGTLA